MSDTISEPTDLRGPEEHDIRGQIVVAAAEHFRRYGYYKTTVSDLARAIGFSKAYVYKFFASKQAIGEVICGQCLDRLMVEVKEAVHEAERPQEKIRRLFSTAAKAGLNLWFHDFKLYEIAASAATENWAPVGRYERQIEALIEEIVIAGRQSGAFERKTPLDETTRAINHALRPYMHPLLLEHNLDRADSAPLELASLVLRSLAP
ncbi:TetR/AcrR family transcriptional regulator [Salinisphaera japonica]|uniref:AcrR family transcriptional regulator n=1 Tax=Salinisphaera japonica YTM-1 TaxID=1209778 RepID=A0A423Q127_9GAMM|nr:TetR/AcrR family transcriptional regulator [Salinisphaera japonica]ROO31961.1 AcrR family transcriptional regulator [Salinisphaera japonica YTM-1]